MTENSKDKKIELIDYQKEFSNKFFLDTLFEKPNKQMTD